MTEQGEPDHPVEPDDIPWLAQPDPATLVDAPPPPPAPSVETPLVPEPPAGRGRHRWVVAGVAALFVVGTGATVAVLSAGGDDDGGAPAAATAPTTTAAVPATQPTAAPTTPSTVARSSGGGGLNSGGAWPTVLPGVRMTMATGVTTTTTTTLPPPTEPPTAPPPPPTPPPTAAPTAPPTAPPGPEEDPNALEALDWVVGAVDACGVVEVLEAQADPIDPPIVYRISIWAAEGELIYLADLAEGMFYAENDLADEVSGRCFS